MHNGTDIGVFVLGMHRSGTSAVARAVSLLGFSLGDQADLIPPGPDNPRGFWESKSLVVLNDELLSALGGSWDAPPSPSPGWTRNGVVSDVRERARELFTDIHPARQWVWKDPRNSLTLPFWAEVLEAAPAIVLVVRNPLEIWRSLERRNGFSKALSLALWERYTRDALANANGLPVFVTSYEDLLEHPKRWLKRADAFLRAVGAKTVDPDRAELARFLDPELRHSRFTEADVRRDRDLTASQVALFESVLALRGAHASLDVPNLPEPSIWTAEIIRIHGDVAHAESERAELAARATALADEIGAKGDEIRRLQTAASEQETRLEEQRAELEEQRAELEGRGKELEASRSAVEESNGKVTEQARVLEDRRAEIERLRREADGARIEQAELRRVLAESHGELERSSREARSVASERDELRAELQSARAEVESLKAAAERDSTTRAKERAEREKLAEEHDDQARQLRAMGSRLEGALLRQTELRRLYLESQDHLSRRDLELRTLHDQLAATVQAGDALRGDLDAALGEAGSLRAQVQFMEETRVWRLGSRYWGMRDRAKRLVPRRS